MSIGCECGTSFRLSSCYAWNKSSGQNVSDVRESQILNLSMGGAHFAWRCSSSSSVACELICGIETWFFRNNGYGVGSLKATAMLLKGTHKGTQE